MFHANAFRCPTFRGRAATVLQDEAEPKSNVLLGALGPHKQVEKSSKSIENPSDDVFDWVFSLRP